MRRAWRRLVAWLGKTDTRVASAADKQTVVRSPVTPPPRESIDAMTARFIRERARARPPLTSAAITAYWERERQREARLAEAMAAAHQEQLARWLAGERIWNPVETPAEQFARAWPWPQTLGW